MTAPSYGTQYSPLSRPSVAAQSAPPLQAAMTYRPSTARPAAEKVGRNVPPDAEEAKTVAMPSTTTWTRLDRSDVDSDVLDEAHEKYEQRDDYFLVLRELSDEEIQLLEDRTQELRAERRQTGSTNAPT